MHQPGFNVFHVIEVEGAAKDSSRELLWKILRQTHGDGFTRMQKCMNNNDSPDKKDILQAFSPKQQPRWRAEPPRAVGPQRRVTWFWGSGSRCSSSTPPRWSCGSSCPRLQSSPCRWSPLDTQSTPSTLPKASRTPPCAFGSTTVPYSPILDFFAIRLSRSTSRPSSKLIRTHRESQWGHSGDSPQLSVIKVAPYHPRGRFLLILSSAAAASLRRPAKLVSIHS